MLARLRLLILLVVSLGLLGTFSVVVSASAEDVEPPATLSAAASDSDDDGTLDAPDTASAASSAKSEVEPVEDLSQRTERRTVLVNPDRTLTSKEFATPVRIKQGGEWVDVDYTLAKQSDGSWAPKASPVDVSINAGPAKEAARVTFDNGESLAVTWPTDLPEPTVNGGVATYKLSNASDLVLAVTSSGVNAHLRLNQEPAADDPVFTFGLRAEGVALDQTDAGRLKISGDDGKTIAETSTLIAWDDRTDYAGDPANVVDLDATLTETTTSGDVTQHTLELTTPGGFLTDPETQYPVVIDPDIGMTRTRDTYVRSGDTTNRGSAHNLIVGKIDPSVSSNGNPTRSYLKFYHGIIEDNPNVDVVSAELGLYQYYGYSCTDRRMYAYPVGTSWGDSITHANVPAIVGGGYSTYVDENRGAAGCTDGWTRMNVTKMAKAWNSGAVDMQGLRLHAGTEDMSSFERRFCSMDIDSGTNCNTAARTPYLSVTYNTRPTVGGLAVKSSTSMASLAATVADAEQAPVRARFVVKQESTTVFSGYSDYAASGEPVALDLPALPNGTYSVQAWANDGILNSANGSATQTLVVTSSEVPIVEEDDGADTPNTQVVTSATDGRALTYDAALKPGEYLANGPDGSIDRKNAAGQLIGNYSAVAIDDDMNAVIASITFSGGTISLTIAPSSSTTYPIFAGPVFEEN